MAQDLLWFNGEFKPLDGATVPLEDRGAQFSDGIYEVVLFYNKKPFMLKEHLERWEYSAEGIMMKSPGTLGQRETMLHELVERSGYTNAMVYGQLTRGNSKRNHLFPDDSVPCNEYWFVREAPAYDPKLKENGVKLVSHPDERWGHCEYKTISLLPNCLAKERAKREGGWEALLYTKENLVTECSASNAYCVIDGKVHTHPLSPGILGGITRMAIIDVAKEKGIPVVEQAATLDQFRKADEAFISSSTMEVMPVTKLDDGEIGNGKVGHITKSLMDGMREKIEAVCGEMVSA